MKGDVFSYEATVRSDGVFQVSLRNEIESPVDINTLDPVVISGGRRIHGAVQPGYLPHTALLPGESVHVLIAPDAPIDPASEPQIAFDLDGISVRPDPARIWDSIIDRTTLQFFRRVTVKTVS